MLMTRRDLISSKLRLIGGALLLSACARTNALPDLPELQGTPEPRGTPKTWEAAYSRLEAEGKLARRVEQAYSQMERCELCPRRCGVNRRAGQQGFCQAPEKAVVYGFHAHYGEELPLVGHGGSGTIFFSNCNLRCVFCQNWPIAHEGRGNEVSDEELANMMLRLQGQGCHNINLVTPTHVMPNILNATRIALQEGLRLPLCYNTGGYERVENIKLLDGIVDIYLPDLKFMDGEQSDRYAGQGATDYPEMAQESIIEMHRQVGDLVTNHHDVALRGLMVRHLVMPNRIAGTREFVKWVARNLSTDTYVNIMAQYRVEHRAFEYELIARSINSEEFIEAIEWAKESGLTNLDARSLSRYEVHRRRVS